jgi:hypothetical protein
MRAFGGRLLCPAILSLLLAASVISLAVVAACFATLSLTTPAAFLMIAGTSFGFPQQELVGFSRGRWNHVLCEAGLRVQIFPRFTDSDLHLSSVPINLIEWILNRLPPPGVRLESHALAI